MKKDAVSVVDDLLCFISTVELFRANQNRDRNLHDVMKELLKHEWIVDAVRFLKDAVDSDDRVMITLSNSNWIDLLEERDE